MKRIMKYVVTNIEKGKTTKPNVVWNGGRYFLFEVTGMSDSDYAKEDYNKSVSGWSNFLNGAEK